MCRVFGCLPSQLDEEPADELLQVWQALNIYEEHKNPNG